MPERIDFWGVPQPWGPIAVYSLVTLAFVVLLLRTYRQASLWWRLGRPEMHWDKPFERLLRVFQYSILQVKILAQRYPGIMHVCLFSGFCVLFLGTALATINGHFFKFLVGTPYLVYKLALDTFTIIFLVGAGMAAYRRFIQKPKRLKLEPRFAWSLGLLVFIVVNGLLVESFRLAILKPDWAAWSPAGWAVAQLWIATGASTQVLYGLHLSLYTLHFLTVSALFVVMPSTTLAHIFTAPLNIFFADPGRPAGRLLPLPQDAKGEPVYAATLRSLSWKALLESDACTECGRCQDVCPSYTAGIMHGPRELVFGIKDSLHRNGQALSAQRPTVAPVLVGDGVPEADIWACSTCRACDDECPVLVEHVDRVVDFRRYLVSEGRVDALLQGTLANLNRYGNSFGQSERARARWAASLQPKVKDARKEPVEYLWFVGDYASYNPTLLPLTRLTAELFQKAGLDFGLLYEAERNAGNDVRRAGEEGLFEFLVEKNAAALEKSQCRAVVTTDPHSYNTLKNEYPASALAGRPVLHYTELLDRLISSGKLKLAKKLGYTVTYHDPCYLGRYNQVYDAPRRVIAATGCKLVEMPHTRAHALCCGAGGGRIWMEEAAMKERPSENRVREAAALGQAQMLVTACPKDVVMFRDAVKTTGLEERLVVKDLAELVSEAI
jgi:Fe-S oxidoreductase/nitrate reductase gamma subunit